MRQKLLPLAQELNAPAVCQRALAAIIAEDGISTEELSELVEEGKVIFPKVEELTLYFRSRSGDDTKALALIQTLMMTEWKPLVRNSGRLDAGDHGLMIFAILDLS